MTPYVPCNKLQVGSLLMERSDALWPEIVIAINTRGSKRIMRVKHNGRTYESPLMESMELYPYETWDIS